MIRSGFNPPATVNLPNWASRLINYYWFLRVEGRDSAKRMRYYRMVKIERLRLVETGLSQEVVDAVCSYLIRFNGKAAQRLVILLNSEDPQQRIDFTF